MANEPDAIERDSFAERLAAATPTPGGGAAAARVGLYACSLLRMVTGITLAKLSKAKPGPAGASAATPEAAVRAIEAAGDDAAAIGRRFQALELEDMAAFQSYLDALRLPRGSPELDERRREARRTAAARATDAPVATIRTARDTLLLSRRLQELSRSTPLKAESDMGAAVELAMAACRVAELNIRVNLPELAPEKQESVVEEWKRLSHEASALYEELRRALAGIAP
jgi:formiminotetrahydrofolate cyclodeaminase